MTPPEPRSPAWLPALGAVLFILAGLWWALTPSATDASAQPAGAAQTTNAAP